MAFINIPRHKDDPNYRYTMPKMISKIEGRGNGIKTNVFNMGDIARALKRPPMYPTKFFGCELGAMAKFVDAEEKALVNGAHNEKDLINILDKFIQMYVLCPGCELPEIDMMVTRKSTLTCKCNACGYTGDLDHTHKAATYMIRNPPNGDVSTLGKKKKSKDGKKADKLERQKKKFAGAGDDSKSSGEDAGEDSEGDTDGRKRESIRKKKEKKEKKDKLSSSSYKKDKKGDRRTVSTNGDGDAEDPDSSPNTSNMENGTTELTRVSSRDKTSFNSTDSNEVMTEKKKSKKKFSGVDVTESELTYASPELDEVILRLSMALESGKALDPADFAHELRVLQVSQDFNTQCRAYVTFCVLFRNCQLTPAEVKCRGKYLRKAIGSATGGETLHAFEHFVEYKSSNSIGNFPYLVQALYLEDVLSAGDIIKYYDKVSESRIFQTCQKSMAAFIAWLNESDDDDDDDDDFGDEEETAKHSLRIVTKPLDDSFLRLNISDKTNGVEMNCSKENEDVFHDAEDGEEDSDAEIDVDNI